MRVCKHLLIALSCCALLTGGRLAADEAAVAKQLELLDTATGKALYAAVDELGRHGTDAAKAVPALVGLLGDADDELRWRAARTLGSIGPAAAPAVGSLSKALEDESQLVRAQAAYALGKVGEEAKPAAAALVKAITDEDALVRRAAVGALFRIKPDRSITIPLMGKLLEDAEPSVVIPVLHTLAEMGPDGVPILTEALDNEKARYWAVLVLSEIGEQAAPAVPKLMDLAQHEEPELRMEATLALGHIGPKAKPAVTMLVDSLTSDEFNAVRYAAAYALGQIGDPSIKAALQAAVDDNAGEDGDTVLRVTAAQALAALFPDDEAIVNQSVEIFTTGIGSEDRNVRLASARALAQSGASSEVVAPRMVAAIEKADEELIGDVIGMLSSMGAEAVPRVKNGLANEKLRPYAVIVLANIGAEAEGAVPELVDALDVEGDDDFRREVLFTLGRIGKPSLPALDKVIAILESTDNVRIQSAAAYALGAMGPAATKSAPALVEIYNKGDEFQKMIAIWSLLKVRPGHESVVKRAIPLLTKGLSHPRPDVRLEGARALGEIGPDAASAVPELQKLAADEDEFQEIRDAANAAIGKIKP